MNEKLRGVIAAILTPVTVDLTPDLDRLAQHCRWLLQNGCDGINLLGTTGEAASYSGAQRTAIMRGLGERGAALSAMMVGTGAAALEDAVAITRSAMELGFGGALVIPPFYYKDLPEDGIIAFYQGLIARVGSDVRLYLYHFPKMSGVPLTVSLLGRLLDAFPQTILGLKDSSGDAAYAAAIHRAYPSLDVFPSSETTLLAGRRAGFAGCISASVNVSAPFAGAVWRGADDAANQAHQAELGAIRAAISSVPLIPALRYLVAQLHNDPEWLRPMPPLAALSPAEQRALVTRLRETTYRAGAVNA